MLLVHWSQHNLTNKIVKNGIRLSRKAIKPDIAIKGVWCFPYTQSKTLNANWKSFLKKDRNSVNYNGFVFRLHSNDFPIYAGDFTAIITNPSDRLFATYESFINKYGYYFNPKVLAMEITSEDNCFPDYGDFEIILTKPIPPERIVKILKDREPVACRHSG